MFLYNNESAQEKDFSSLIEAPIFIFMYIEKNFSKARKVELHSNKFTELFYFTKGEGVMQLENFSIPIKKDDFFIVPKNVLHTENILPDTKKGLAYKIISVDNSYPFDNGKSQKVLTDTVLKYSFETKNNRVYEIFENIYNELTDKNVHYENNINLLLSQLFIESVRLLKPHTFTIEDTTNYVLKIKSYILENFDKPLNLDELSALAYVSKVQLINKFKKTYGVTPIQFLNNERITQAKKLLKNTNLSITQIAINVGFNDSIYFSNVFKKSMGVTPTHYRNLKNSLSTLKTINDR